MKVSYLVIIAFLFSYKIYAQEIRPDSLKIIDNFDQDLNVSDELIVYGACEIGPSFPGGNLELKKYLKKNTVYPINLINDKNYNSKMEEIVFVKFIIEKDGHINYLKFLTENKKEFILASYMLVSCMPNWNPGKNNNLPVRTYVTLPIRFCLKDCKDW